MGFGNDSGESKFDRMLETFVGILNRLTVGVWFFGLALLILAMVEYGSLVNYYGFDSSLVGTVPVGTAILGFLFGVAAGCWLRRKQ